MVEDRLEGGGRGGESWKFWLPFVFFYLLRGLPTSNISGVGQRLVRRHRTKSCNVLKGLFYFDRAKNLAIFKYFFLTKYNIPIMKEIFLEFIELHIN